MKKTIILLSAAIFLPLVAVAQEDDLLKWEKGVYALKMSPNGKWVGSMAGDASIYEVATGENVYYEGCFLGVGNAVADNGMAVGDEHDIATVLFNKKIIYPETLNPYWFCDINAITPDATRIAGIINNTSRGVTYVPFIASIDSEGNVGEPLVLPYPDKDFFGSTPQYVTAVWISNDGHTVVGNVQDMRGLYSYPIYYKEDAEGNWSYVCPSESLFNPTGIEIPQNPWMNEPAYPEPENFMTGVSKDAYLEAFQNYSVGAGPMPDPKDYMTEEQYKEFEDAVNEYNEWFDNQEANINAYFRIYLEVLQTSPSFSGNDMTMHPSGEYFMISGAKIDENGEERMSTIFRFSTIDDEISELTPPGRGFFPYQILSDGTLIITKGQEAVPTSYIMLPDSDKFITAQEYFNGVQPSVASWIDEFAPGGSGVLLFSEDKSVITGALTPYQLADFDWEFSDFYYSTYFVISDNAGVERIEMAPADGIFRVYNLEGMKVLETKDAEAVKSLDKGVYIVNGKKIRI